MTFCFGPHSPPLYVNPMSRAPAAPAPHMKGYFAVGVERISKAHNVGAIMRTAHAFGASYFFSVSSPLNARHLKQTDTSKATSALPFYEYATIGELKLPKGAKLVGVELTDDAVDLPVFKHPRQAVYILGPEGGNLSPEIIAQCDHTVKIPMRFCVNVGIAASLVMYDRLLNLGPQLPRG